MELLFRKHFWAVNLLFLALVAFLSARTVNQFVAGALNPLPSGTRRAAPVARPVELPPSLSLELMSKFTGIKLPAPEPLVTEPAIPVVDLNAPPVKTSLRLKLLGTLIAGSPEWSFASIQDVVTLRSQTYMIGDTVQGAEILEIERSKVIILNNNRREFISAEPGDGASPPPVAAAIAPPPGAKGSDNPTPNVLGQGIKAIDENNYEIPRAEIDRTLSNLNDVAMQARIVPAFKDGVATGFKLFSIRPDSIYTKIGIQNGDVIKRINGFDLNSPEKALEIYSKLKESARIDIEVERNGSPVKKTYNVR